MYPVLIFYSDPDEAYVAETPDLPGCSALGDTAEEALAELRIAQRLWLETARALGKPIPAPSDPLALR